jgi:hypothetical protein
MSKSLPLMIRHAMYNLRGGFLIRPLPIALALGCAGALLSWLEEEFFSDRGRSQRQDGRKGLYHINAVDQSAVSSTARFPD